MNSCERVIAALNHRPVDRVPVDFGGTGLSGGHVSIVAKLRSRLGLGSGPVKVSELAQMLGEVDDALADAVGSDVVGLGAPTNIFAFPQDHWKPWRTFDGTDVLVPGLFNTDPAEDGSIWMYAEGDRNYPPSAKMPKGGFYFDAIIRQKPIIESQLKVEDNLEEFSIRSEETLKKWEQNAKALYSRTDRAIATGFPGTAFGDVFLVPAIFLKDPKGIRDIEEWYISTISRRSYVQEIFERQSQIAVENLKLLYQAVGEKVQVVFICGTDLAAQDTLFCSPETYKTLYVPYHKRLNDWIHKNTGWKTMKHCCGACEPLIGGFIEAGFDILNPVQCSAKGMEPEGLVDKYGKDIVFWGGGVDTQKTLPFGTPKEVYKEVQERVKIFSKKNGFVFAAIHNIQCSTPVENVMAMFEALKDVRG
ncbi:MAG: methyltransferase [Planctomycetota bacterium]|nr:methyltransferase [Planctomycetota bacterium]